MEQTRPILLLFFCYLPGFDCRWKCKKIYVFFIFIAPDISIQKLFLNIPRFPAYSLTRHIRKKHSENSKIVIKCDKCQKTFNKISDLREHEILCKNRKFKEKSLYRCNVQNCEYKSETRKMVKKHLERVHDTKVYIF